MITVNVNTNELVEFSESLRKMHKSAFPLAVRGTLNDLAFNSKQYNLQKEAAKVFTVRKPSFFRAFSGVSKAGGFDVNKMQSSVGFLDKEIAGKNMEQQEVGGVVGNRSLVPLGTARVGMNEEGLVRRENYLKKIKADFPADFVDSSVNNKGKTQKQRFIRAAIYAKMRSDRAAYIIHKNDKGRKYLIRIGMIASSLKNKKMFFGSTLLYNYEEGRVVTYKKKRPAIRNAAVASMAELYEIYTKNFQKQVDRLAIKK